jgi:hypothetical protein
MTGKLRKMKWTFHLGCRGQMRKEFKILVRKSEERDLGKPRPKWKGQFEMDWVLCWIVVNTVVCPRTQ